VRAASQLRIDDLLSRLSGTTIRRGYAPVAPGPEEKRGRLSTGCPEIDDLLGGGVPRGRLSELIGHGSAGTTSIAQRLLAGVTAEAGFAAWVDVADAFDPVSASAAGVVLDRLLWVRPPDLIAAFAAAEILLATGGFALVLLDTSGMPEATPRPAGGRRRKPAARPPGAAVGDRKGRRMLTAPQTWLRLARAAERSRAALVLLSGGVPARREKDGGGGNGISGVAAGVRTEVSSVRPVWEGAPGAPARLEGLVTRIEITRNRGAGRHHSRSRQARIRLP